jgi:hypothetical protein
VLVKDLYYILNVVQGSGGHLSFFHNK